MTPVHVQPSSPRVLADTRDDHALVSTFDIERAVPRGARATKLMLWLVLVAAVVLRVPAITHDLPSLYTHDEVSSVETALRFGTGVLRPYSFGHGTLMPMVLAVAYATYYGALRIAGVIGTPADLLDAYIADPTPFYLIARGLTVVLALVLVVLVHGLATRLFSARAGIMAAALVAAANLLVVLSVSGREDLLYVVLVVLGAYLGARAVSRGAGAPRFILIGLVVGLATSAKYFGVFGLVFALVAIMLSPAPRVGAVVRVAGGFAAGIAVGMPFVYLTPAAVFGDAAKLATATSSATYAVPFVTGFAYPTTHVVNSVGEPLWAGFLLATALLLILHRRPAVYLLAAPWLFLLALVTRPGNQGHYYVALAVPFACVAVAGVIDLALARVRGLGGGIVAAGLTLTLLAPNLIADWQYLRYTRMRDTRDAAKTWIEANIPAQARLLVETRASDFGIRLGPPIAESVVTLERELADIRERGGSGGLWQARIAVAREDRSRPRYDVTKIHTLTPRDVRPDGTQYLVLSSGPEPIVETYRAAAQHYVPVAVFPSAANFAGDTLARMDEVMRLRFDTGAAPLRGPAISVWRRRS